MATTPQSMAQALTYGPKAAGLIRRSQYVDDALKALQETGGQNIRSPAELASKLIATALLQKASHKAENASLGAVQAYRDDETARLLAGFQTAQPQTPAPAPQPAPPQAQAPMPAPQAAPPVQAQQQAPMAQAQPAGLQVSPQDRDGLIRMLATEAIGEGPEGMVAAGHVALNRLKTGYQGARSLADVVNAPHQFEGMSRAGQVSPQAYQQAAQVADAILSGQASDPTNGAVNFLNPELQAQLGRQIPAWAQGQGQRIGRHVFFGGQPQQMAQQVPPPPMPPNPNGPADQSDLSQAGMGAQPFEGGAQGLLQPGNIDLAKRPVVHNPDGSISTVRSISVGVNGKTVLIPTVVGNRVVSNDEAIQHFRQSGEHLGVFADEPSATAYAQQLHQQQAAMYSPSAPDRSPPAVGAPPAVSPQAAAGGNRGIEPEQVALMEKLLRDPRTHEAGVAYAMELQKKAAEPTKYDVKVQDGFTIATDPQHPDRRMVSKIDELQTRALSDADAARFHQPPGTVVQQKADGTIIFQRPDGGQMVASGPGEPYRERPIPGGRNDPYQAQTPQQGFAYAPGGGQAPISGGPADPRSPQNLITGEGKLRDDYDKQIQPYILAREGYQKVVQAASDPTQAGAIAMVFGYMKTLDPGSTVREGEQASVQNSGTIPQTVTNLYNKLLAGKSSLSPEQRADFARSAQGQFEVYQRTYDQASTRFGDIAKSYGYEPTRIVRKFDAIEPYHAPREVSAAAKATFKNLFDTGKIDTKAPQGDLSHPFLPRDEDTVRRLDTPANVGKYVILPNGDLVRVKAH